jgi:hypothetical protein
MKCPMNKRGVQAPLTGKVSDKPWMHPAGILSGPPDLSMWRGFSSSVENPSSSSAKALAEPQIEGAERRQIVAHGVSRGSQAIKRQAP